MSRWGSIPHRRRSRHILILYNVAQLSLGNIVFAKALEILAVVLCDSLPGCSVGVNHNGPTSLGLAATSSLLVGAPALPLLCCLEPHRLPCCVPVQ